MEGSNLDDFFNDSRNLTRVRVHLTGNRARLVMYLTINDLCRRPLMSYQPHGDKEIEHQS